MPLQRLLRFILVGTFGAVLNTGLLWFFTGFWKIYYLLSSLCSIELCILFQFFLNDRWTFHDRKTRTAKQLIQRVFLSNTWRTGGILINLGILWLLTEFQGINYLVSNGIGILAAFLFNYLLESKFTWKESERI
jgi:dolichol-phosphate mannosyltransferase